MKKDSEKLKWMFFALLALTALSIALTVIVVKQLLSKETAASYRSDIEPEVFSGELFLENCYVICQDASTVTFCYEGEQYRLRGSMDGSYRGIADITVTKDGIQHVTVKQTQITGTLLSYTDDEMEVEGYGLLDLSEQVKLYRIDSDRVEKASFSEIAIGDTALSYVISNGKICAVLLPENEEAQVIRVLLKNGDDLTYDSLYLTGSEAWTIGGTARQAETPVDMIAYLNDVNPDLVNTTEDGVIVAAKVRSAEAVCESGYLYITDSDGNRISRGYEGTLIVREAEDGAVLINRIAVEDYVRYVLLSEMDENAPLEALKAQAVCARTYAYAKLTNSAYAMYGANLDDSSSYQVYNKAGTSDAADRAAAETSGEVILYENDPITCYYYSTSPGITADLEVWGEESPGYIVSVATIKEQEENLPDLTDEESLKDYLSAAPDSYDSGSPYYRWRASIAFSGGEDAVLGKITGIEVARRSAGGYAANLAVTYEKGTSEITGEYAIRSFLGRLLKSVELSNGTVRTDLTMLPSACFFLEAGDGNGIAAVGGGFGHGIGMSQSAACAMAEDGMDYTEIIRFFYKDTIISEG